GSLGQQQLELIKCRQQSARTWRFIQKIGSIDLLQPRGPLCELNRESLRQQFYLKAVAIGCFPVHDPPSPDAVPSDERSHSRKNAVLLKLVEIVIGVAGLFLEQLLVFGGKLIFGQSGLRLQFARRLWSTWRTWRLGASGCRQFRLLMQRRQLDNDLALFPFA